MSMQSVANIAIGYSRSMDAVSQQLANPDIASDPAAVAQFNTDLFYATQGYQLASNAVQTLHKEDSTLSDLLRDA